MNREPCPDRLAFQIARTTISPNYPGEELETLIARSWSSLRTYRPRTERQMKNTWSARTPMPTELLVDNKNSRQLPQLQVNTQATPGKATITSGCKHMQLRQTINNMNLVQTTYVPETS
jgi:hypothetical protein